MKNNVEDYFKSEYDNGRDSIFNFVKKLFMEKPLKIGEIGCARDPDGRGGDGWSTFFWADYIYKNGGSLSICDIDQNAINFVKETIPEKYNIEAFCMDGTDFIKDHKPFDFVYLDGSNSQFETAEQFLLLKDTTNLFLVDDWDIKGFIKTQEDLSRLLRLGFGFMICKHESGSMGLINKHENE